MATSTERIPVLVTSEEKAMISRRAQDAHLSMGEFCAARCVVPPG